MRLSAKYEGWTPNCSYVAPKTVITRKTLSYGGHFCTLEIGLVNFSRGVLGSFLGLFLPNITYLKCMQSLEWKFGDKHICEPNMTSRTKPYFMGEHFCTLEIGLAKFSRGVFGSFLGLLLPSITYLAKVHAKYGSQTRPNKHMLNKYVLPRKKFGHKNGTCVQMFGKNGMFVLHTILL